MPGTTTRWAMPAAWWTSPATCSPSGSDGMSSSTAAAASHGTRNYVIVTLAYWGFTLTDGALRMLVLLHFYALGYTPFTLAMLFLLYETAGIFANLGGGWLALHFGIRRMLAAGLVLQIGGLLMLSALDPAWGA